MLPRLAAIALLCSCTLAPPSATRPTAPTPSTAPAEPDPQSQAMARRLTALDRRIDAERTRLGIPGLALVIVRDGEIVHSRGYGTRVAARDEPVGADTMFAIGSTTKAFTAMLVMMAVEAGKLALDDHPRRCLPGFKLARASNDAQVTVRDLLTHSTGLPTADLAWATGALSRDELVALLGEIEPVAEVRQAFHYQNLAYVAAGECAAKALGGSYDALLRERILQPLGMDGATLRVATMQAIADAAHGHHRDGDGRVREVPMRVLDAVAPAGGLNASAAMLGHWLQLLLAQGRWHTRTLLSPESFATMIAPQFPSGPGLDYALGWVRTAHKGHAMLTHTGGIDGFSALVTFVPERGLGFALLANVDHGDIHGFVSHEVLALLEPERAQHEPSVPPLAEAGTYGLLGGFKVEVVAVGDGIALEVPGQPRYPLEPIEGRRYRLGAPAPEGFFAGFAETEAGVRELLLEQPFGNMRLGYLDAATLRDAATASPPASLRALLGRYAASGGELHVELAASEGALVLRAPGQPPVPLSEQSTDHLALVGAPESFWVEPIRDRRGRVTAIVLHQPSGDVQLRSTGTTAPPELPLATLLAARARAHGSAALARHRNLRTVSELHFVHQGLRGRAVTLRAAPQQWLDDVQVLAFGREIARLRVGVDQRPWQSTSLDPTAPLGPREADAIALDAAFDGFAARVPDGTTATVWRSDVIDDRPVVVVRFVTDWGAVVLDSYDAKSFRLRRRELDLPTDTPGQRLQETRDYDDWRVHGGVALPHRTTVTSLQGTVVSTLREVAFDVELAPRVFAPPP
ncbi:MAG: beta-lactamase family protein [Nannocystaceae bacterium]|nr:beta-lactamase family protein [Nannocystaceae bacterium]